MEIISPNNPSDTTTNEAQGEVPHSYNTFLYEKRREMKLSRFRFARFLKIPWIRYRFIENGYMKPTKKECAKISAALQMDFEAILDGLGSYPEELPEKPHNKVTAFFYHLMGVLGLRIALGTIAAASVVVFVGSIVSNNIAIDHQERYYDTTFVQFYDTLRSSDNYGYSLITDFRKPQFIDNVSGEHSFIIQGAFGYEGLSDIAYFAHFWEEDYRVSFRFNATDETEFLYLVSVVDYKEANVYRGNASVVGGKVSVELFVLNGNSVPTKDTKGFPEATEKAVAYLQNYSLPTIWLNLAEKGSGMEFTDFYKDLIAPAKAGADARAEATKVSNIGLVVSLVVGFLSIFTFFYAMVYGESKKKPPKVFAHTDELLGFGRTNAPMKRDIRFSPFLPETFFEILGILLIAVGSLRVVAMLASYAIPGLYSQEFATAFPAFLLSVYFMGMFLLYFIDFDLFLDDKRVMRNVVLYFLVFLALYFIETTIWSSLQESSSIALSALGTFFIPNNFMAASCYFLIMFFLFFTPMRIKTKRGLILFRCCAALPILYIFTSFVIYNGDVFFGWTMNIWVKYWFSTERLSYSVLCVLYLVGLFFLRLFFKKKYGEEGARRYFNGNRFLFLKNAMLCLIVITVWVADLFFIGNKRLNQMGIGVNTLLIFLLPLLVFYHPHKGPRNRVVDYATTFIYAIAITYAYIIAGLLFLFTGLIFALL